MKKAILMICFGTSVRENRQKTIECIGQRVQASFQEYVFYQAWTSDRVRKTVAEQEGLEIPDVKTALQRILADGNTAVVILPLFMVRGLEYERVIRDAEEYRTKFDTVLIGEPLLEHEKDIEEAAEILAEQYVRKPDQAIVLIGHGTDYESNDIYIKLGRMFSDMGREEMLTVTLKDKHALQNIANIVKEKQKQRILLVPCMITAGNHVLRDISGDDPESWKARLQEQKIHTECVIKGLGENRKIQEMFLRHAEKIIHQMDGVF